MNNRKFILFIVLVITCGITGCSNIFQKEVEVVGSPTEEVENKNKENNNTSNNDENEPTELENITDNDTYNNTTNENEGDMVDYFSNIEEQTNQALQEETTTGVKNKVTNFFVNIIDFIFYDKEINGVKFNELTDEAKEKILNIAQRMDNSINNKFPGYKENIKSKSGKIYTKASDKIKEGLNYLGEKTEEKIGTENYNNLQDNYENMKDSAKNAFSVIKDGVKNTKDKVKNWYEEKTGK